MLQAWKPVSCNSLQIVNMVHNHTLYLYILHYRCPKERYSETYRVCVGSRHDREYMLYKYMQAYHLNYLRTALFLKARTTS